MHHLFNAAIDNATQSAASRASISKSLYSDSRKTASVPTDATSNRSGSPFLQRRDVHVRSVRLPYTYDSLYTLHVNISIQQRRRQKCEQCLHPVMFNIPHRLHCSAALVDGEHLGLRGDFVFEIDVF